MDDTGDNTYGVLEAISSRPSPLPRGLTRNQDGFSRQDVVNALATTFQMIGGVSRMALWANANPDKFYPLYAKLLPSTSIQIGDNSTVVIQHAIPKTDLDEHPTSEEAE
jgi:hypothetical protein